MGLEAINFLFRSDEQVQTELISNRLIINSDGKNYIYKKEEEFWIDIELQDSYSISVRIALCNPKEYVLMALHHLLSELFSFRGSYLKDMNSGMVYNFYDSNVRYALKQSYERKREIFESIYGDYTAAIGSEEFYRRLTNG